MRTLYVRELVCSYRPKLDPSGQRIPSPRRLHQPDDTAAFLRTLLEHEPVEVVVVVFLSGRYDVLCVHEVSRGGISFTCLDRRDIVKAGLLVNCSALIVAHSHPSGDPTPSPEDRDLTSWIYGACRFVNISLLDHVIIGADGAYCSFKQSGLLRGCVEAVEAVFSGTGRS